MVIYARQTKISHLAKKLNTKTYFEAIQLQFFKHSQYIDKDTRKRRVYIFFVPSTKAGSWWNPTVYIDYIVFNESQNILLNMSIFTKCFTQYVKSVILMENVELLKKDSQSLSTTQ